MAMCYQNSPQLDWKPKGQSQSNSISSIPSAASTASSNTPGVDPTKLVQGVALPVVGGDFQQQARNAALQTSLKVPGVSL